MTSLTIRKVPFSTERPEVHSAGDRSWLAIAGLSFLLVTAFVLAVMIAATPAKAMAKGASGLPHMGSATIEGRLEMGDRVIINIRTLADGHRPPDRVLPNQN